MCLRWVGGKWRIRGWVGGWWSWGWGGEEEERRGRGVERQPTQGQTLQKTTRQHTRARLPDLLFTLGGLRTFCDHGVCPMEKSYHDDSARKILKNDHVPDRVITKQSQTRIATAQHTVAKQPAPATAAQHVVAVAKRSSLLSDISHCRPTRRTRQTSKHAWATHKYFGALAVSDQGDDSFATATMYCAMVFIPEVSAIVGFSNIPAQASKPQHKCALLEPVFDRSDSCQQDMEAHVRAFVDIILSFPGFSSGVSRPSITWSPDRLRCGVTSFLNRNTN